MKRCTLFIPDRDKFCHWAEKSVCLCGMTRNLYSIAYILYSIYPFNICFIKKEMRRIIYECISNVLCRILVFVVI